MAAVAPEKNPLLIQDFHDDAARNSSGGGINSNTRRGVYNSAATIPLILFPGGGATVYKFFLLDDLGRRILAFWDPNIASSSSSTEELEEVEEPARFTTLRDVARHFVDVLREEMEPGPVLLGGWSCGGNIALEAAHILASSSLSSSSDPRHHRSDGHCGGGFEVAGLVLIDTGFPNFVDGDNNHKTNEEATAMLRTLDLPLSADIPRQSQRAMRRAMRAAREMLVRWRAPWWDGVVGESDEEDSASKKVRLPKAVLFRAVNDLDSVFGGQRSARLGWEAYPYDFIESVVDVGGDHFTLFDEENIHALSDKLREACDGFERGIYAERCEDGGRLDGGS